MPAFLAPLAISLGSSLLGRALNRHGGGGRSATTSYDREVDERARQAALRDEEYLAMLREFDPTAGYAEATNAALDAQEEEFARGYANRIGSMVGRGRIPSRSGFGLHDAQELVRQGQRERESIRQMGAERAQAARSAHLDRIGAATSGYGDRAFRAREDRINTREAQRATDAASRRGMFGQLLAGAIGVLPEAVRVYRGGR